MTEGEVLEYPKYKNKANWAKRHVLRTDAMVRLHEKIIKQTDGFLWCERNGTRVNGDHLEECDQLNEKVRDMAGRVRKEEIQKIAMDTKRVVKAFDDARRVTIEIKAVMTRKPEHRNWIWKKFKKDEERPEEPVAPE